MQIVFTRVGSIKLDHLSRKMYYTFARWYAQVLRQWISERFVVHARSVLRKELNTASPPQVTISVLLIQKFSPRTGSIIRSMRLFLSSFYSDTRQDITGFTEIRRSSPFTPFFGGLTTLRKASISFVISVCPPVCPSVRTEQLGPHCTDFRQISLNLRIFRKPVEKI